jgi:hypothetical protein
VVRIPILVSNISSLRHGGPARDLVFGSSRGDLELPGAMREACRGREEVWPMPYVTCPTCGERGKIPSSLIGARIKCRKCGLGFQVSPPATKAVGPGGAAPAAGAAATATATTPSGPSAAVEMQGIEDEGLDASSWAVPTETVIALKAAESVHAADPGHEAS